jgi:hypothetical protein
MRIRAWIIAGAISVSASVSAQTQLTQATSLQLRSFDPSEPRLSDAQKMWALALTGILTERNRERHDLLGGEERTAKNIRQQKQILQKWWGTQSRQDLLESLQWIDQGGHRQKFDQVGAAVAKLSDEKFNEYLVKLENNPQVLQQLQTSRKYYRHIGRKSILGWDYGRFISLCRWGYLVEYINDNEAWNCIMPAARLLQGVFASWKDLGENYLIGREFWSYEETKRRGQYFRAAYQKLLDDPNSPWNRMRWDLSLQ